MTSLNDIIQSSYVNGGRRDVKESKLSRESKNTKDIKGSKTKDTMESKNNKNTKESTCTQNYASSSSTVLNSVPEGEPRIECGPTSGIAEREIKAAEDMTTEKIENPSQTV